MRGMRIFVPLAALAVLAACGSDEGLAALPAATPVPSTPTPEPPPTVAPPPAFNLADYRKGDQVTHLMEGLGSERAFPAELLESAPPLPKEEAAALWRQFLSGTRVVEVKIGEVWDVTDYCDRTGTLQFSPNKENGGNWFIGMHIVWDVAPTEYAEWNEPRLVWPNPTGADRANFVLRSDFSGVKGGGKLLPPGEGGRPRLSSGDFGEVELVVYDHPQCVEITPLREFSAAQYDLLGFGEFSLISEVIKPEDPQLPRDELLRTWMEFVTDITVFLNLQGTPWAQMCGGAPRGEFSGEGINISRYEWKFLYGSRYTWHLTDARQVAKNAIWLFVTFEDNTQWQYLIDIERDLDPYIAFLPVKNPDCSIEQGLAYLETVEVPD